MQTASMWLGTAGFPILALAGPRSGDHPRLLITEIHSHYCTY